MTDTTTTRFRLAAMRPRDPGQSHRTASTLELFFDLVFVVAVSTASVQLHHALGHGDFLHGIVSYAMVFFAIWWAWMNFTWFATSFDTDDWLYRVMTIVQMSGVLVLAAGVPAAFGEGDFTVPVIGYVVMRVAMIGQWLRASRTSSGSLRTATMRYALGIAAVQMLWILFLFIPPELRIPGFVLFALLEVMVPLFAEYRHETPWHPHHITERYGLFTLIVLGESLLASANAIIDALHKVDAPGPLILISVLTLVMTAALWWIYFWPPHHRAISSFARSLWYGYTHYFVFAAAAAMSAGIEVQIDLLTHESHVSRLETSLTIAAPVAIFLIGVWWIAIRDNADRVVNLVIPIGAVLVLAGALLPHSVLLTTVILVGIVVVLVVRRPVEASSQRP